MKKIIKKIFTNSYTYLLIIFFMLFFRFDANLKYLFVLFEENAGAKESVPTPVYHLKTFINNLEVKDFKVVGKFKNTELWARSIEYIYPIRFNNNSKNVFTLETINTNNCLKNSEYNGIKYYVCK